MSVKETFEQVVDGHNLLHIATLDSNGIPCVRGVDYAAGDEKHLLYFVTRKDSRKVDQITNNGNVAIAVDHDCPEWDDLQNLKYFKGTGMATIVTDPEEMQQAFGLLIQKFPFIENLPGDPSDFVAVKVELKEVFVTDNTISFAHTEKVTFA